MYTQSKIVIEDGRKYHLIPYEEIEWIKAEGNYCLLYIGKQRFLIRQSLHYFQNLLEPLFFRCHRSVIINLSLIELYDHKNNKIHLKTGIALPVARALRKVMLKQLYLYSNSQGISI